jgi:VCBS repeat-containing protein
VGTALLSPQGTVSDSDSSSFVSVQVQISTGFMSGDKLFLTTAASQTLSSAGFTESYNAATGLLTISTATSGKVLSQEDVTSVLAGVSFSTTNAITTGESRVVVYTVQDNSASATAASNSASLNLTLQDAPFAAIQSLASVQTLVFTGDPKSDNVSVDLSTFRVLANGAAVGVSGGNLFSVKDVNASGATSTSVQLVGSSVANKLTGTSLGDTLTGGGGADTLIGGAGDDYFLVGTRSSGASELATMAALAGGSGSDTLTLVSAQSLTQTEWAKVSGIERIELEGDAGTYTLILGADAAASFTGTLTITGDDLQTATLNVDASDYTGALSLLGTDTDDTLMGGTQNDTIVGGAGDDSIRGGAGQDTLTGGEDEDTFVFTAADVSTSTTNADLITDLAVGDKIDLSNFITSGAAESLSLGIIEVSTGEVTRTFLEVKSQANVTLAVIDVGTAGLPGQLSSWSETDGVFTVAANNPPSWTVPFSTAVQRLELGRSGVEQEFATLSVTDIDAADVLRVSVVATGGVLSLSSAYTSNADNLEPELTNAGATMSLSGTATQINEALAALRYTATTAGQGQISLTVNDNYTGRADVSGVIYVTTPNSKPIAIDDTAFVLEGATTSSVTTVTGDLRENVQLGDGTLEQNVFAWGAEAAKYGTLTRNADGTYSYAVNNTLVAVQQLTDTQTLKETFSYRFTDIDGDISTANLVITITGTNDVATVSSAVAALTETLSTDTPPVALPLVATGTLTVVDVDTNQNKVQAQTDAAGNYGTFSVNAAGEWSYTVNPDLNLGDLSTDTFTVISLDGTGQGTVTVTIKGTNDAAVITPVISSSATNVTLIESVNGIAVQSALIESNAVLTTSGTVTVTDPDAGENKLVAQSGTEGTYGTFTATVDGVWTYTASSHLNQLKAGDVVTETFTLTSKDGNTTLPVVIKITGTNDAPVLTGTPTVLAAGTEDSTYTLSAEDLLSGYSDPEGSAPSVSGAVTADHGTVTYNSTTQTYTITPEQNYNGVVTLSYGVSDGAAGTAGVTLATRVFSLTAASDPAVISGDTSKAVQETDAALTVTGNLSATDVDVGGATTFAVQTDVAGTYGQFTITSAGAWTYTATTAHNEFVANTTYTDIFTVTTADGTAQVVRVDITGTNDAPALTGTPGVLAVGAEDAAYTVTAEQLISGYTDPDNTGLIVQGAVLADHGTVVNNGNGTYTITATPNYSGQVNLTYTVSDGLSNVAASQSFELVGDGADDFPIAEADLTKFAAGEINYDANDNLILELNFDDAASGSFLSEKLSSLNTSITELGRNGLGIDQFDVQGSASVNLDLINVQDLITSGMSFSVDDQIELELELESNGTFLNTRLGANGLGLGDLGTNLAGEGIGLDVLSIVDSNGKLIADIELDQNGGVSLDGFDAQGLIDNGLQLAQGDYVTLESDADGTFLSTRMGLNGNGIGSLSSLGIDLVNVSDANGNGLIASLEIEADNLVRIDQLDASGLIDAGLQFSTYDDQNVTLDLSQEDANGTFLSSRMSQLGNYNGLGVDTIDIAGDAIGTLTLSDTDAYYLDAGGIEIAQGDYVTLESDADGTFLSTRMGLNGNGIGSLSSLGIDLVNVSDANGNGLIASLEITDTNAVRIDHNDISGLVEAGLSFANGTSSNWVDDNVTLDLTAINDGHTLGSYLGTQVATGGNLKSMGVDSVEVLKEALVDLIDTGTSNWDAPWEWQSEFGPGNTTTIKVAIDSQAGQSINDQPVQLGNEIADIVESLVNSGVQFPDQQSLGDLLEALTDSGIAADSSSPALGAIDGLANAGITDFQLKAQSNVVMSDELARALFDAGMMEAVPQAKVQIDAGMNEILKTPFKLLAEYGVDKVTTGLDKVYMELGDIYDLTAMSHAVAALMDGQSVDSGGLFHLDTSGFAEHVSAGLILDGYQNTALIDQLMSSEATSLLADLLKLGITELDIKGYTPTPQDPVVGTKVKILGADSGTGAEYTSIDLNELLRKQGQH